MKRSRVELQVYHRAPPQVADRGMPPRYGWYWGNEIPGVDQNKNHCLVEVQKYQRLRE